MSVVSSLGSVRSGGSGKLCPGCHQPKLRSNELHDSCFDCLSHHALSLPELKCGICKDWIPRHWVQATAYYPSDSPARLAAVALSEREMLAKAVDKAFPSNITPLSPEVVVQNRGVGESNPVEKDVNSLETSVSQIPQEQTSFLANLFNMFKGPQVAGLSSLLQAGLPSGQPVAPPPGFSSVPSGGLGGMLPPRGRPEFQVPQAPSSLPKGQGPKEPELSVMDKLESSDACPETKRRKLIHSLGVLASQLKQNSPADFAQAASLFQARDSDVTLVPRPSHRVVSHSGLKEDSQAPLDLSDRGDQSVVGSLYTNRSDRSQCESDRADESSNGDSEADWWARRDGRGCDRSKSHGGSKLGMTRPTASATATLAGNHARSGVDRGENSQHVAFPMTLGSSSTDRRRDQTEEEAMSSASRDVGDSLTSEAGAVDSVFRWALESISRRMGREVPKAQPVVGKGAFATTPQAPFISLPVASSMITKMEEINHVLATKVEPAKTDCWYPSLTITPEQHKVFATIPTGQSNLVSHTPSEDRKQTTPVWSAYVRKARLLQWQTASHQLMGQFSLLENLTKFMEDLINESSMLASERDQLKSAVSVVQKTLVSAGKVSTTLAANLDLTVRDAELKLLDLTPFQLATFRASPLISGELFGGITRTTVEEITSTRMLTDIHALAEKGGSKGASSAAKSKPKTNPKSAAQPSRLSQPFRGQAVAPQGQQPSASKRGGKGGKGKKSKR